MNRYLIFALLGLWGCTDTNTVVNPGDKPIVEAYLSVGSRVKLTVSTEIPYSESSDGKSTSVDNLAISLAGSDGRTFQLTNTSAGVYESAQNERVGKAGTTYTLNFTYKGRTISATTEIPPKPQGFTLSKPQISRSKIDLTGGGFPSFGGGSEDNTAVEITWQNPDNAYYFVAAVNIETSPEQIVKLPNDLTLPGNRFTNQPVAGTATAITPQSFQYFGRHTIILYRVNADYAALYKSSGTSTQNLSTPPTSILNGLGIFTGVNADTLAFQVSKK